MARAPAALRLVADRAATALATAGLTGARGAAAGGHGTVEVGRGQPSGHGSAPGQRDPGGHGTVEVAGGSQGGSELPPWTIAIAVSGGGDSLALLHALRTLAGPRGWRLRVLTVDHGLRPGSAADAAFVVDHAKSLGLEAERLTLAPGELEAHRGAGPEGAARAARYEALRRAAAAAGCDFVATGHTLDDQAETVLLALLRGTGPDGLAGMAVARGGLLRPLLGVTREQTRACCEALGLRWREDPSNADQRLLRNAVRHRLLPLLEELRPGAAATLARLAGLARDDRDWTEALAAAALESCAIPAGPAGGVALDTGRLAALPVALARRVVRLAAARAGLPPPDAAATERVLALSRSRSGSARWAGGGHARRAGNLLRVGGPPLRLG